MKIMLLKLLTSRIFWGTIGVVALGLFINNWISNLEKSITAKIENEIRLVAKDEQIKAIQDRLDFIVSEQEATKVALKLLDSENREVRVISTEIIREIILPAEPQPIAPLSPVIADTSEALAADWDKTYGGPK